MSAALRMTDIACVRGGRMLINGFSLTLAAGESALLRGPNGIGKSSLIRLAAGLLPAFAGSVERSGGIAMSDENLALDRDATLSRALGFWAGIDGASADMLDAAMRALDLRPLADIPVRMLSTGQRKRAMLVRVMTSGAALWLLDEPANGLDSASLALLEQAMQRHLASGGIILAASHQPLALSACREIALADYRMAVA